MLAFGITDYWLTSTECPLSAKSGHWYASPKHSGEPFFENSSPRSMPADQWRWDASRLTATGLDVRRVFHIQQRHRVIRALKVGPPVG